MTTTPSQPAIRATGLRKSFGDTVVLDVVGGDAGEGHEVHHPLLGPAADRVGEAGLAQAAGADDRGDPGGAPQAGHRGDVVVAADQRIGLVRDAVPDHRGTALEQLLLHGLEGGAGVGAELVAQRAAVGLVPGQGGRGAERRRGLTVAAAAACSRTAAVSTCSSARDRR